VKGPVNVREGLPRHRIPQLVGRGVGNTHVQRNPNGDSSGGKSAGCAKAGVFEGNRVMNVHPESSSPRQIGFGVWLGVGDVIGGNDGTKYLFGPIPDRERQKVPGR